VLQENNQLIGCIAGAVTNYGRRWVLPTEQNIERLIKAAWEVMERDFDESAVLEWRKRAFEYLTETLGPDHYYTQCLGEKVSQAEALGVLSGTGVLSAAKEQIINGNCQLRSAIAM